MAPKLFLLIASLLFFFTEVYRHIRFFSRKKNAIQQDKASLKIVWATIVIAMFIAGYIASTPYGRTAWGQPYLFYAGAGMFISGFILRAEAIRQLDIFFTVNVEIQKEHQLIQSGLYSLMRHPSYTGALLMFYGVAFCFYNWISTLLILAAVTIVFTYRISVEEKALRQAFGKEYNEYANRVKRLMPSIL